MAGRPRTKAKSLQVLAELAVELSRKIDDLKPRDIVRKSYSDRVDADWLRVSADALEVAITLGSLAGTYRERAGLPRTRRFAASSRSRGNPRLLDRFSGEYSFGDRVEKSRAAR